jgi:hypothetical protein
MPAETHSRRDRIDSSEIVEMLENVLGLPPAEDGDDPTLAELGCDGDLSLLDLWDAAVEEYGERTLGEPDLDELRSMTTLAEVAGLIASRCNPADGDLRPADADDRP